ncbi:cell wall hydrolase [Enterovirga rhinocerotis]
MARAMYFESNRSSETGMLAVGTVVMNRLNSGRYPGSVCAVVGQRNQFAPGVLSKPVSGRSWALALETADAVLSGRRHAGVQRAKHFHTAGYTFPYRNMAYVVAAGGNVFYEKRAPGTFTPIHPNVLVARAAEPRTPTSERVLIARAEETTTRAARGSGLIQLASADRHERTPLSRTAAPSREPAPSQRAEGTLIKAGGARLPSLARDRGQDERADRRTAERPRQDRLRFAQLEDKALPDHGRTRSDASSERSSGFDLPKRPSQLRAEPSKPSLASTPNKSARSHPSTRDEGIPLAYKNAAKPKVIAPSLPPAKPNAAERTAKHTAKKG